MKVFNRLKYKRYKMIIEFDRHLNKEDIVYNMITKSKATKVLKGMKKLNTTTLRGFFIYEIRNKKRFDTTFESFPLFSTIGSTEPEHQKLIKELKEICEENATRTDWGSINEYNLC